MIFKFQRAINNKNRILAYNKEKSIKGEWDGNEETLKLFGLKNKIYCECETDETELLKIVKVVRSQKW